MKKEIYSQILNKIKSSQNILITTHENPDGDAIGSVCAFYEFLKINNKQGYIFCADQPNSSFHFLPHIEQFKSRKENVPLNKIDLVVALDCGSIHRSRIEEEIKKLNCPVINIDHHLSNNNFGTINLVDASAVATAQLLDNFFKYAKIAINKNIANCILTGIQTDSGNFAYSATNSEAFEIASKMLIKGAKIRDIIASNEKNKTLPILKVWGVALSRLQHNKHYGIASTVLRQEDLKRFDVVKQDIEGLASFLNNLKDVKIVLVLYELSDGRVKGSFRTNRNDVDVARLAQVLGGGGHRKSAGFEIMGTLEKVGEGWKVV